VKNGETELGAGVVKVSRRKAQLVSPLTEAARRIERYEHYWELTWRQSQTGDGHEGPLECLNQCYNDRGNGLAPNHQNELRVGRGARCL
jgi:hypothetical protein